MNYLRSLRNQKRWTQAKLAKELVPVLKSSAGKDKLGQNYLEKRISELERGRSANINEKNALADLFGITLKELEALRADSEASPTDKPSSEYFNELMKLADEGTIVFLGSVYGGRRCGKPDSKFDEFIVSALRKNVSFALFLPYPSPERFSRKDGASLSLGYAINTARKYALDRYKELRSGLTGKDVEKIALYAPNLYEEETVPLNLAPFNNRQTLVIKKTKEGVVTKEAFTWSHDDFRGGSVPLDRRPDDPIAIDQARDWFDYMREPASQWLQHGRLGDAHWSWAWRRVNEVSDLAEPKLNDVDKSAKDDWQPEAKSSEPMDQKGRAMFPSASR